MNSKKISYFTFRHWIHVCTLIHRRYHCLLGWRINTSIPLTRSHLNVQEPKSETWGLTKRCRAVHSTRLKLQLLEHVPGLCEAEDGRNVLLTLDSEVGQAVFEVCNSNTHDDRIIIAKAVHILWKQLFLNKEVLDGDLGCKRQSNSVPLLLVQMTQMTLEGNASKISNKSSHVAVNKSHLTDLNP